MKTIDIITRCMGRRKFLEQALPTWLPVKYFNRIIIVDWGAQENLPELLEQFPDPRLIILQFPNVKYFNVGSTRNVGVRYSDADYVFHIDCDIKINPEQELLLLLNEITSGKYSGIISVFHNWTPDNPARGFTGIMITDHKCHDAVNGFVESLSGRGYEDRDFLLRVLTKFRASYLIKKDWFFHIEHDKLLQTSNLKSSTGPESKDGYSKHILKNMNGFYQRQQRFHCTEYTAYGKRELIV